jgi:hypothetical protein
VDFTKYADGAEDSDHADGAHDGLRSGVKVRGLPRLVDAF